jgi:nitrogen fixation protein FixH
MRTPAHHVVLAAVAAAGLGAVAGAVWIGSRVREEPVVDRPYEEGLRQDADRAARARLRWDVRIESSPVAAGAGTFTFAVLDADGEPLTGAEVEVAVARPDTSRGVVHGKATAIGPGRFAADSGVQGGGEWLATFDVTRGGDHLRIERALRAAGGPGGTVPCDLGAGACTLALPRGGAVTLELGPRPLRTMRELAAVATVTEGGAPAEGLEVRVALSMPGMTMGENVVALRSEGAGRHQGRVTVVRCLSGRKDWVAEVSVARPGQAGEVVRFPFTVSE